jgi:putative oxidoreductase
MLNSTFLLRLAVAVILLMHSVPTIMNGSINAFGNLYLKEVGFGAMGIYAAWAVKLSHIACALCFLLNKYLKPAAVVTIFVLIMGIIMIHYKEGWFVVGGGRNGVEFNFLLIAVLLTFLFPKGFQKS